MRERWKPENCENKSEADALETKIKALEYELKFARGEDERGPFIAEIDRLNKRLGEYCC